MRDRFEGVADSGSHAKQREKIIEERDALKQQLADLDHHRSLSDLKVNDAKMKSASAQTRRQD